MHPRPTLQLVAGFSSAESSQAQGVASPIRSGLHFSAEVSSPPCLFVPTQPHGDFSQLRDCHKPAKVQHSEQTIMLGSKWELRLEGKGETRRVKHRGWEFTGPYFFVFESQLCLLGTPEASISSPIKRGQRIYLPLAADRIK